MQQLRFRKASETAEISRYESPLTPSLKMTGMSNEKTTIYGSCRAVHRTKPAAMDVRPVFFHLSLRALKSFGTQTTPAVCRATGDANYRGDA
jgi:hypothetical protein